MIVGAGPTGLAAAILLARHGVASLVLERHHRPYPLPRAVHADDEVVRILQGIGVAAGFAAVSRPASGLRLLSGDHRVIAEFRRDRLDGVHGHPQSNLFDQPDLERLLREEAARHPGIEIRTGVEVTGLDLPRSADVSGAGGSFRSGGSSGAGTEPGPGPVLVHARGVDGGPPGTLRAAAVLGCDGANSTVRDLLGVGLQDLGFEERWLVVDLRCAVPLEVWDGVDQVCDPRRAATSMRIGPDRYRWEFRLHPGETAADLSAPQRLSALLAPWTSRTPGAVPEVVRAAEYTFRARLAERWRVGRVFLLGDAAHQTPPFIGQGLGSGLRDAQNLGWKLARVLHGGDGAGPDERLLDSYEQERRPHARTLIRLAVVAGWAMTGGQDRAATLRRVALAGFCRLPKATDLILQQTGPPLRPGPLVARRPFGRRPDPVGRLIPQPWVRLAAGPQEYRLDDVLGAGFAVVTDGTPGAGLSGLADRLRAPVFQLAPRTASAAERRLDAPPLRRWLAAHRVGSVLLRPDRVVLLAAPRAARRPG